MPSEKEAASVAEGRDKTPKEAIHETPPATMASACSRNQLDDTAAEGSGSATGPNNGSETSHPYSPRDARQEAKDALSRAIQKVEDLSGLVNLRQEISRLKEATASINSHPPKITEESSSPAE